MKCSVRPDSVLSDQKLYNKDWFAARNVQDNEALVNLTKIYCMQMKVHCLHYFSMEHYL